MDPLLQIALYCQSNKLGFREFCFLLVNPLPAYQIPTNVVEEVERALAKGYRALTPAHEDYPAAFRQLQKPPLVLWVKGEAAWHRYPCLSVVGSRNPSIEALRWLEQELNGLMRARQLCIVSGAARGVDQKAHQMALRCECPTVMVLPSGIDSPYPSEITEWFDMVIANHGAIVSPFPPFKPMHKRFFPARNELIAALGSVLLVVEAKRRSGTALTASHAVNMHKSIAVMPTYPTLCGLGGLDLFASGAHPVIDYRDILTLCESAQLMNSHKKECDIGGPSGDPGGQSLLPC